jgi:CRISPR-associated endonuclease Cas1
MAASDTVPQFSTSYKSSITKSGVLSIHGFGLRVRMQTGHLEIEDGIGPDRRKIRIPRVGHGLKRLVCVSEDGFVTLAALKWLADQRASFIMLDRAGRVSVVTGPVASSDARLRRAQALAHSSDAAVKIVKAIMNAKLEGQQALVRDKLGNSFAADSIAKWQDGLSKAENLEAIALCESQGAANYWSAWNAVQINFPRNELSRVPEHWLAFGTRKSAITGSARLATNPPNAILNYCYSLLESESRLALAILGLDPGIGMLHVDTPARDSLACDLMEAVRPAVDAWLLDWIGREPFKRSDFVEESNGNCRLIPRMASQLNQTATAWGKLVAPWAEFVARTLWVKKSHDGQQTAMPSRLTQQHRREAKGNPRPTVVKFPKRDPLCRECGKKVSRGHNYCAKCAIDSATKRMVEVAKIGRIAASSPESRAKQSKAQLRHSKARSLWNASEQPSWLTPEVYSKQIYPLLLGVSASTIASRIGVGRWYAGRIRAGYRPHPRHWRALAVLVGIVAELAE